MTARLGPRRRRLQVVGLALAVALVALVVAGARAAGGWLIVADPLEKAPAIAVLSGGIPFRAMAAARLYHDGWAPEIWLTRVRRTDSEDAFVRLGVRPVRVDQYDREVLAALGVPAGAVQLLPGEVVDTVDEAQVIAAQLRRRNADLVIVVTSRSHTRRARATWRAVVGEAPRAIVRPTGDEDGYEPDRWWANSGDALKVTREVFGLLNVWTGFPIQPRR